VQPYREAKQALASGDPRAAAAGFRRVLELAPDFSHALHGLCWSEAELGERDSALVHCRRAVALDRSGKNLSTLAMVLVNMGAGGTDAELQEALKFARDGVRADPLSVAAQGALCQVAMLAKDVAVLAQCVEQLEHVAPDDFMTYMFAASLAIAQARWADARAALEKSRALGLPDEPYEQMKASIARQQPRSRSSILFWVLAAGAAVALLVLVALLVRRRRAGAGA